MKQKHAGCPAWVADGHRIVYFAAGTPYVANPDTTAIRKPSAAEQKHVRLAQDSGQTWSKYGKFLDVDLNWQVVRILTLHGTAATFRWSDDYSLVWSPDRRKLAFVRMQKTEQIFILDTVGRRSHRLAAGTNPAWSPDGSWIAFESKNHVLVVPVRGGAARQIGKGRHPVWSPDSRLVAATGGGVFVMSRDGEPRRRIDRRAGEICGGGAERPNERPAWSHDGRMLAFAYWCEADQADELAVVGSDGTFPRVVAQGNSPQWSRDDTQIAFIDPSGHLAYVPAAGGSGRVLDTRNVKSFSLTADGRLVAYSVDIPSKVGTEIWVVQTDGTKRRPLLQGGSDSEPAWRP